jgi:hypothetical protein
MAFSAYMAKCGTLLIIRNPGATSPVLIPPTLMADGNPIALTPGPVDTNFWSFTLPPGVGVNAYNALSVTAPAQWYSGAAALSLPVTNYACQTDFPLPATKTMALGMNFAHGGLTRGSLQGMPKNFAQRLSGWDSAARTLDSAGNVTSLTPGFGSQNIFQAASYTPLDTLGSSPQDLPTLSGTVTLIWDSADPRTTLDIVAADANFTVTQIGGATGNGTTGTARIYSIVPSASNTTRNPILALRCNVHPTNSPSYTNPRIYMANNVDNYGDSGNGCFEQSIDSQIRIGSKGPSSLRFIDTCASAGQSNTVLATDLPGTGPMPWAVSPKPNATVSITQIDPCPSDGSLSYTAPDGTLVPMTAANLSRFNYGANWVGLCTCAAAHGFQTGQMLSLSFGAPTAFTIAGNPFTISGAAVFCFPVNSTQFVYFGPVTGLPNNTASQVTATTVLGASATAHQNSPFGGFTPYYFVSAAASKYKGCAIHIPIPIAANDACVTAIATQVLNNSVAGQLVIPELANENWNSAFTQTFVANALGSQLYSPGGFSATYEVLRTQQVVNIFKTVFGARAADVQLALYWNMGLLGQVTGAAIAHNVRADIIGFAPYLDLPSAWAATTNAFTPRQLNSLYRAWLTYSADNLTAGTQLQAAMLAITTYETWLGGRVKRWSYEGALERFCPIGSTNQIPRTWDAKDHPDAYDTELCYYSTMQNLGLDLLTLYAHTLEVNANGATWGIYSWSGQSPGFGDARDGKVRNIPYDATNNAWLSRVSPRGQAWRDWQTAFLTGG